MKKVIFCIILSSISILSTAETYFGVNIHRSVLSTDSDELLKSNSTNGYEFTIGHNLGDIYAIEASYLNFGDWPMVDSISGIDVDVDINVTAFTLSGLIKHEIADNASIYLKNGLYKWKGKTEGTINGDAYSSKGDGDDIFYGLGITGQVKDDIGFNVKYMVYHFDDDKIKVFSIGVTKHY